MLSRRFLAVAAAAAPAVFVSQAHAQNAPTELTLDRIQRTKVLRIAALPGEAPYFNKDLATGDVDWDVHRHGKDIAGVFDAKVEYIESTYGNSVLDLQANKIDLAFALNPTPKRALVIDFTHPFYLHGFGMVGKKGFKAPRPGPTSTSRRSRSPSISARRTRSRRGASRPMQQIIGFKMRDECDAGGPVRAAPIA